MNVITPEYGIHYKAGYVGFSRPNNGSFLSKGIIWFQRQDEPCDFIASHVFLVFDEHTGIESAEKGVEFFRLKNRINDPALDIVFRKPEALSFPDTMRILIEARRMEKAEVPYDYTGLIGWVLRSTLRLDRFITPLRKLPVPLRFGVRAMFCSAFVSTCLKAARRYCNIPLFREWHPTRISPAMLWNHGPWTPLKIDEKGGK